MGDSLPAINVDQLTHSVNTAIHGNLPLVLPPPSPRVSALAASVPPPACPRVRAVAGGAGCEASVAGGGKVGSESSGLSCLAGLSSLTSGCVETSQGSGTTIIPTVTASSTITPVHLNPAVPKTAITSVLPHPVSTVTIPSTTTSTALTTTTTTTSCPLVAVTHSVVNPHFSGAVPTLALSQPSAVCVTMCSSVFPQLPRPVTVPVSVTLGSSLVTLSTNTPSLPICVGAKGGAIGPPTTLCRPLAVSMVSQGGAVRRSVSSLPPQVSLPAASPMVIMFSVRLPSQETAVEQGSRAEVLTSSSAPGPGPGIQLPPLPPLPLLLPLLPPPQDTRLPPAAVVSFPSHSASGLPLSSLPLPLPLPPCSLQLPSSLPVLPLNHQDAISAQSDQPLPVVPRPPAACVSLTALLPSISSCVAPFPGGPPPPCLSPCTSVGQDSSSGLPLATVVQAPDVPLTTLRINNLSLPQVQPHRPSTAVCSQSTALPLLHSGLPSTLVTVSNLPVPVAQSCLPLTSMSRSTVLLSTVLSRPPLSAGEEARSQSSEAAVTVVPSQLASLSAGGCSQGACQVGVPMAIGNCPSPAFPPAGFPAFPPLLSSPSTGHRFLLLPPLPVPPPPPPAVISEVGFLPPLPVQAGSVTTVSCSPLVPVPPQPFGMREGGAPVILSSAVPSSLCVSSVAAPGTSTTSLLCRVGQPAPVPPLPPTPVPPLLPHSFCPALAHSTVMSVALPSAVDSAGFLHGSRSESRVVPCVGEGEERSGVEEASDADAEDEGRLAKAQDSPGEGQGQGQGEATFVTDMDVGVPGKKGSGGESCSSCSVSCEDDRVRVGSLRHAIPVTAAQVGTVIGHVSQSLASVSAQLCHVSQSPPAVSTQLGHVSQSPPAVSTQLGHVSQSPPAVSTQLGHVSQSPPAVSTQLGHVSQSPPVVSMGLCRVSQSPPVVSMGLCRVSQSPPAVSMGLCRVSQSPPAVSMGLCRVSQSPPAVSMGLCHVSQSPTTVSSQLCHVSLSPPAVSMELCHVSQSPPAVSMELCHVSPAAVSTQLCHVSHVSSLVSSTTAHCSVHSLPLPPLPMAVPLPSLPSGQLTSHTWDHMSRAVAVTTFSSETSVTAASTPLYAQLQGKVYELSLIPSCDGPDMSTAEQSSIAGRSDSLQSRPCLKEEVDVPPAVLPPQVTVTSQGVHQGSCDSQFSRNALPGSSALCEGQGQNVTEEAVFPYLKSIPQSISMHLLHSPPEYPSVCRALSLELPALDPGNSEGRACLPQCLPSCALEGQKALPPHQPVVQDTSVLHEASVVSDAAHKGFPSEPRPFKTPRHHTPLSQVRLSADQVVKVLPQSSVLKAETCPVNCGHPDPASLQRLDACHFPTGGPQHSLELPPTSSALGGPPCQLTTMDANHGAEVPSELLHHRIDACQFPSRETDLSKIPSMPSAPPSDLCQFSIVQMDDQQIRLVPVSAHRADCQFTAAHPSQLPHLAPAPPIITVSQPGPFPAGLSHFSLTSTSSCPTSRPARTLPLMAPTSALCVDPPSQTLLPSVGYSPPGLSNQGLSPHLFSPLALGSLEQPLPAASTSNRTGVHGDSCPSGAVGGTASLGPSALPTSVLDMLLLKTDITATHKEPRDITAVTAPTISKDVTEGAASKADGDPVPRHTGSAEGVAWRSGAARNGAGEVGEVCVGDVVPTCVAGFPDGASGVLASSQAHIPLFTGRFCLECSKVSSEVCLHNPARYQQVRDRPLLSRARATLPDCLYLALSPVTGHSNTTGVFARQALSMRTEFGPLQGKVLPPADSQEKATFSQWKVFYQDCVTTLDVSDEHASNWLMFVKPARCALDRNLLAFQRGHDLMFVTTKEVSPDQELCFWFATDYGKMMLGTPRPPSYCPSCFQCSIVFLHRSELQAHNRRAHAHQPRKTWTCPTCHAEFSSAGRLKTHETSQHLKAKAHVCPTCGKTFADIRNLRAHCNVHAGLRRFGCDVCGKYFMQKAHLQSHQATHTKVKAVPCRYCSKRFVRRSDMRQHELTHTQEQAINCPLCSKTFQRPKLLRRHMRTVHHNQRHYLCDRCSKTFHTKYKLTRHAKSCKSTQGVSVS